MKKHLLLLAIVFGIGISYGQHNTTSLIKDSLGTLLIGHTMAITDYEFEVWDSLKIVCYQKKDSTIVIIDTLQTIKALVESYPYNKFHVRFPKPKPLSK